jgi:hypothetical protein
MITFTQLAPAALDEAAAIVEAEWMRLQRRDAARADDPFAEPLATERSPPRRARHSDARPLEVMHTARMSRIQTICARRPSSLARSSSVETNASQR